MKSEDWKTDTRCENCDQKVGDLAAIKGSSTEGWRHLSERGCMVMMQARIEQLTAALTEVEWEVDENGRAWCPWCGGTETHTSNCSRQKALEIVP